jgi:predicted ATPase
VLGREFPLGLMQCVTRKPGDELERRLSLLQAGEFIYEQPTAGDVEYIFKHALTQEVAYTRCWSSAESSCTNAPEWRWSQCLQDSWTTIWRS